jgi:hypothetical protein
LSYFVVGVGGTGAKLMTSLIHLSAAGLLPDRGRALEGLLVDPDEANGNVDSTNKLSALYRTCKTLKCGTTDLFKNAVNMTGPWTPVVLPHVASLSTVFGYTQLRENNPVESDLMDLFFTPEERELTIFQGFRGRPAIGSTIFGKSVDFRNGTWNDLRNDVRAAAANQESVPILLAGSVFGGSGAAGVPTICRLLQGEFRGRANNVRLGLTLFLPYFSFSPVPGDEMQADPHAFATATAESLKYYDEGRFLDICHSIYAIGDETPAQMAVSAVGAGEQRNDPHYIELVAGLGAIRFMSDEEARGDDHTLSLAARQQPDSVRWQDLPVPEGQGGIQIARLQRMALFAVAFRYLFYPNIVEDLKAAKPRHAFVVTHLIRNGVNREVALAELANLNTYVEWFLWWFLKLATPGGVHGFRPGLVNPNVFAIPAGEGWRLKIPAPEGRGNEFHDRDIETLFLNAEGKARPNLRNIWHAADRPVNDADASGTGRLVRAIYDACNLA